MEKKNKGSILKTKGQSIRNYAIIYTWLLQNSYVYIFTAILDYVYIMKRTELLCVGFYRGFFSDIYIRNSVLK